MALQQSYQECVGHIRDVMVYCQANIACMQQRSSKTELLPHLGRSINWIRHRVCLAPCYCTIFARKYDAAERGLATQEYQMSMHGSFRSTLCVYTMYLIRASLSWRTRANLKAEHYDNAKNIVRDVFFK